MRRIGVLTSGGDAPGMNAAVRAVVRSATFHGMEVVAYRDGYTGLLAGDATVLDDRAVGNIIQQGGTAIGTSRCPDFMEAENRAIAAGHLRDAGVEALVVIGGDGSFRGALDMEREHNINVAGIPGTIDNDVWGTEETLGFDTAVNSAMYAIDRLRDTSESTGMNFFVEVMGRTCGALALHTGLAAGASGVLIPEAEDDLAALARRLRTSLEKGKRSHIIVVAEGDDAGGAFGVASTVSEIAEIPYRVVILGHVQRGGSPTARDRVIAAESGAMAVRMLIEGRSGFMIGMLGRQARAVPLRDVVTNKRPPPDFDLLRLAVEIAG